VHNKSSLIEAVPLIDTINELMVKSNIEFDLLVFGKRSEKIDKLVDEILTGKGIIVKRIKYFQDTANWNYNVSNSVVAFMNNYYDLDFFNGFITLTNQFQKTMKILIFCEKLELNQLIEYVNSSGLYHGIDEGLMS
jgi:hypothetical protein